MKHASRPRPGRRVHRPLLLTSCAALAGLGAAGCVFSSDGESGFRFQIGANAWGNLNHHATEERRMALELVAGDRLVLDGLVADVTIRASKSEQGELVGLLKADGRTSEEAEAALKGVRIQIKRDGSEVVVSVRSEPQEIVLDRGVTLALSPRADVRAVIPEGVRIHVREASGEIDITGPVGAVEARTAYGNVSVSRVTGRTEVASGSGDVEVRDTRDGDVLASTNFGDVLLADVSAGRVEVESSSGDVELRSVSAESIQARSSFGDLSLERIGGDVSAETASGDVDLLDGERGAYRLHSNFGQVTVRRVAGTVNASSNNGEVDVVCDGEVEAVSGFGRVSVEGMLTMVSATSNSGDVEVVARGGSAPTADWTITSQFGEVVLRIAPDFACVIEARTEFGDVDDDFGLTREENGAGQLGGGTIGAGGHRVTLRTSSGDIEIRRGR